MTEYYMLIPCKTCREEQGGTETPSRAIIGGSFVKDEEDEAVFNLTLACGHEIEFNVTQEEKDDMLKAITEANGHGR